MRARVAEVLRRWACWVLGHPRAAALGLGGAAVGLGLGARVRYRCPDCGAEVERRADAWRRR